MFYFLSIIFLLFQVSDKKRFFKIAKQIQKLGGVDSWKTPHTCTPIFFKKQNSDCSLNFYHDMSHTNHVTYIIWYNILNNPQSSILSPFWKLRNWDSVKLKLNLPTLRSQDLNPDLSASKVHVLFIILNFLLCYKLM